MKVIMKLCLIFHEVLLYRLHFDGGKA